VTVHELSRPQARWIAYANDACRRDILDRLESSGPLPSRDLADSCAKPWAFTGWTNNRNVTQLLEFMVARGEVAIAGRQGRNRLWDLASRVYPDDRVVPADEARRIRDERRLHALGISRERGPESPVEPVVVGRVGEPAVDAVHREVKFTRAITAAVNREIRDLARWLELDLMHARG